MIPEAFVARFQQTFAALTGHPGMLSWQGELLEEWLLKGRLPGAVDLPTGLGKTSVMALWLIALAEQMRRGAPALPRRLIYVVDRRAVVDQATAEAEKLRAALAREAALGWMRLALGLEDGGLLPVSTLRGKLADNGAWQADPARPAIIAGTVDMTGSRLLFSGYGVGANMRPFHAGLLAVDSLVLLDEAHLAPAFQRLLEGIAGVRDARPWHTGALWPEREFIRRLKVVPLSATQGGDLRGDVFRLSGEPESLDDETQRRLNAPKALSLASFPGKEKADDKLAEALVARTRGLLNDDETAEASGDPAALEPRRVVIYCNARKVAQKVHDGLKKLYGKKRGQAKRADIVLFTGARRVFERTEAAEELNALGFTSTNGAPEPDKPAILVATSAAEVGVDLDADDLVCDLAPLERMIQRFGRVNRRGRREDTRIIVLYPDPLPKKGPYINQMRASLKALRKLDGDASPRALGALSRSEPQLVAQASTPAPLHPPLTLATVESWALTNLKEHTGRPDIQPWLRGWLENDPPQAEILWRRYLPWPAHGALHKDEVERFFAAARPHLLEVLETRASDLAAMLISRAKMLEKAAQKDDALQARAAWRQGIILLTRANRYARHLRMPDLAQSKPAALAEKIARHRIVSPAMLGGLAGNGLLDRTAKDQVQALDVIEDNGWAEVLGFRVRMLSPGEAKKSEKKPDWEAALRFNTDPEADEADELIVEVYRGKAEESITGDPAIARRAQGLAEHLDWARREAEELARRLDLPEKLARPLRLAAWMHDMGKRRKLWQQVMGGDPEAPLAKTASGGNGRLLGGFRHELASVLDVLADEGASAGPEDVLKVLSDIRAEMAVLDSWQRDLTLHLVAAHHGRARPLMPPIDDALPPSRLEREVRAIALRFARLQKQYGPWGLAWLEALLRAADRRASARLDSAPHTGAREADHG